MNKIVHSGCGLEQKDEETLMRALMSCLSKRTKTFLSPQKQALLRFCTERLIRTDIVIVWLDKIVKDSNDVESNRTSPSFVYVCVCAGYLFFLFLKLFLLLAKGT